MTDQVVLAGHVITNKGLSEEKDKAICIDDGKIVAIHDIESYQPPSDIKIRDWRNCTVLPGLVDCHDHLGLETGDEHAQALEHDFINVLRGVYNARKLLAAGITTLRSVGEKNYMDVYWRDAIEKGWMLGPRLVICCKFIMRTGGHAWYLGEEADGPDQIRKSVRKQIKNGADAIKLMITGGASTPGSIPTDSDYTDEEIYAAVDEAHRLGRKVAAHVHGGKGAHAAIQAGIDSIEHGVYLTDDDLQLMAQKGTFLCVTYGVYGAAITSEETPAFMKDRCQKAAQHYLNTISKAHQYGVKVVCGGDTHHGDPSKEFKALIEAGFSPKEALKALTINGAELLGMENKIGSIEPEYFADLVAVSQNPIEKPDALENVVYIMKEGELYNP